MAKANITQYSSTPSSNTDINNINIDENCPASGLNNAIRELMAHLKNVDTGSQALTALSVTGDLTVDTNTLYVDSANNRVMIGTTTEGESSGDDLTIATTGNTGITIRSGTTGTGQVYFSDGTSGTDEYRGYIQYQHSQNALLFGTNASEAMRIDSSGNVGIGTSSPSSFFSDSKLVVGDGTGTPTATIYGSTTGTSYLLFADGTLSTAAYRGGLEYSHASDFLGFFAAGSERMRIDSSGNLLVGKTANDIATVGHRLGGGGSYASFSRQSNPPIYANRNTADGNVIEIQKDGSTVGSIGAEGGQIYIVNGDTGLKFASGVDGVIPVNANGANRDNAIDLGVGSVRFKDLYLSGGVYLGGTGSANKLDDYEEGTWTPTAGSESGVFTATYTSQSGKYTKVGNRVWATFDLQLSSRTLSGSIAFLYGLPFAVRNNGDLSGSFGNIATTNNKGANFYQISIYAQNNASYCYLTSTASNTAELGTISNSFWGASTRLAGGVIYNTV